MPEITKWEYHVETFGSVWKANKDEELENLLNEMGNEGWEVISAEHQSSSYKVTIVAKRPLTHSRPRERRWPGIDDAG